MKTVGLNGTQRASTGKASTKKVRNAGEVPCVMYNGGNEGFHFSAPHNDLKKILHSPDVFIVNVDVAGNVEDAIIREAQFHPVTGKILHVDFLKVDGSNEVELELPIRLIGTAEGVLNGGKLASMMRRIKVRGIPANLPEKVEVDVTPLGLGKTIRVSEVQAEGLTITSPAQAGIARIDIPRALKSAQAEAEQAEA